MSTFEEEGEKRMRGERRRMDTGDEIMMDESVSEPEDTRKRGRERMDVWSKRKWMEEKVTERGDGVDGVESGGVEGS